MKKLLSKNRMKNMGKIVENHKKEIKKRNKKNKNINKSN
jgi:hypothetical protein